MKHTDNSKYHSHGEVWLLLPWYVNGRLNKEQKKCVASHLNVCLLCRKELTVQTALLDSIKQADTNTLTMNASFERLKQRIAQADRKPEPRKVNALSRLNGWLKTWLEPVPLRTAALASMAVVAFLVFPLLMYDFGNPLETTDAGFRTLSRSSAERSEPGDIRIVFEKGLSESEKARIITSVDAQIVNQPSITEVFSIRLGGQNIDSSKLTKAIETLRQRKEVVFAEPVLPSMIDYNLQSEGKR